jgi:hypothetical protein
VPGEDWRPGETTVPRPVLTPIARIVRAELGSLASTIDALIASGHEDPAHAITQFGEALWPRAAEILATATIPADWPSTKLPQATFRRLADCIAAVLRCAPRLRRLAQDEEIGAREPDEEAVQHILRAIASESALSGAMIARVILVRSPRMLPVLRRTVRASQSQAEKAAMQQAIERGIEAAIGCMERGEAFDDIIGNAAITDVSREARRATGLLREIDTDPVSARHRPRLDAIRATLDRICRERFARGVGEGVVTRLSGATQPVDVPGQADLESFVRDLRRLDTATRKVGADDGYDQSLAQATRAVRAAAEAGTITPMRLFRLVELLEGPDAAEALYLKAAVR